MMTVSNSVDLLDGDDSLSFDLRPAMILANSGTTPVAKSHLPTICDECVIVLLKLPEHALATTQTLR